MENKTASLVTDIDRILSSKKLTKKQRESLVAFDRFNELEANCSLGTRRLYLMTLHDLGVKVAWVLKLTS